MEDFFWSEFDFVELRGEEAIKRLAKAEYENFKDDIKGITDLVMVINHKSWAWYELHNDKLCEIYADLYYEYYEKVINYLEKLNREDELTYFIRTLD